jgi:hypothetical protein
VLNVLGMERHTQLFLEFVNVFAVVIKTYWSSLESIPNVIFMAYDIMKTPHDELATCYLNKLWTYISLHNSWIVSFGEFVLLAFFIMYCRMQTRSEYLYFLWLHMYVVHILMIAIFQHTIIT